MASLVELGDFAEATIQAETEDGIAAEVGHPYGLVHACNAYLFLYFGQGDFTGTVAAAERGLEICDSAQSRSIGPVFKLTGACAYARLGRFDRAAGHLDPALLGDVERGSYLSVTVLEATEALLLLGNTSWHST